MLRFPACAAFVVSVLVASPARAWIFHEHSSLAAHAMERLEPADRETLATLWVLARGPSGGQLCERVVDGGPAAPCVDFPTLTALGGDHACTVDELLRTARTEDWILDVQRAAAETERELLGARDEARRRDVWGVSHLRLERIDDHYAARAAANRSHFLLPRRSDDLASYLRLALAPTTEANALGLYVALHVAALRFAFEAHDAPDAARAQRLAARAVTAEAFALHFLQDTFAAGHAAGSWGDDATRKGTHDYYCVHGLETLSWSGTLRGSYGDAHLTLRDIEQAAPVQGESLRQLAAAFRGDAELRTAVAGEGIERADKAARFDVCSADAQNGAAPPPNVVPVVLPIVRETTMPGREEGEFTLPRFRTEMGWFFGAFSGVRLGGALGGYQTSADTLRFVGALEVGARVGFGLEGVTSSVGDGLVFVQGGAIAAGAQLDGPCSECGPDRRTDQLKPRVPARSALSLRIRAPYWLLPGDLLLATPLLGLTSFPTLKRMGIVAADGGLLGIERLIVTKVGTVQLMLGREVGVTFYGFVGGPDPYQAFVGTTPSETGEPVPVYQAVKYRSVEVDIPVVEYRPVRAFDAHTAVGLLVQAGITLDFPTSASVVSTGEPFYLGPTGIAYARLAFDARLYP